MSKGVAESSRMSEATPRRVYDGRAKPGSPGAETRSTVACPLLEKGATAMDEQSFQILNVRQARRVLTNGDIKSDVAFQNDVNLLLASLDDLCDGAEAIADGATPSR